MFSGAQGIFSEEASPLSALAINPKLMLSPFLMILLSSFGIMRYVPLESTVISAFQMLSIVAS